VFVLTFVVEEQALNVIKKKGGIFTIGQIACGG
jgi:hypothetical protein